MCLATVLQFVLIPVANTQATPDYFGPDTLRSAVSLLASDSLEGRGNFTAYLEKAAVYISGQFEKHGLQQTRNFSSYMLPFVFADIKGPAEEVWVNNRQLTQKDYFFITAIYPTPTLYTEQFILKQPGVVADGDLVDLLNQYIDSSEGPLWVLLPESQKKQLGAFKKQKTKLALPTHSLLITLGNSVPPHVLVRLMPDLRARMLFNVAGLVLGKSLAKEIVIISAHYDHLGQDFNTDGNDKIFNGANDNASGTAAMLSLMKYFSANQNNERTLLFIAFAGEELGLVGSNFMSQYFDKNNVAAMINLEMLGKPDEHGKNAIIVTNYQQSKLGAIIKKYSNGIRVLPDDHTGEKLGMRSDHFPFAVKKIPASTFMCFNTKDPTYHTTGDEVETLNFENMSVLVKGLLPGIEAIANGKETP